MKAAYVLKFNVGYVSQNMTCVQIQRDTGMWYSVEYSSFSVGPEADKYRLSVSGFSGDESDALAATVRSGTIANGMKFSSPDRDNDNHPSGPCSGGISGWWFNMCSRSVLNSDANGCWNAVTDAYIRDVVFSRMLVKLD